MRPRSHRNSLSRIRRVLGELDFAQRRLFEVRTGVPLGASQRSRRDVHEIAELDTLFHHGPQR